MQTVRCEAADVAGRVPLESCCRRSRSSANRSRCLLQRQKSLTKQPKKADPLLPEQGLLNSFSGTSKGTKKGRVPAMGARLLLCPGLVTGVFEAETLGH